MSAALPHVAVGDAGRPASNERHHRAKARRGNALWHVLLAPTAIVFALPFVLMVLASFSPASEMNRFPPRYIPSTLTLDGYQRLFATSDIGLWIVNTLIVSTVAVVSHLILCSMAGYGFARLHFKGRDMGFIAILATIMIPIQLLMVPTYVLFTRLGLVDTLGAAIVPWLASAFGVFMMRQFFVALPVELEEAAIIDGATRFQVFFRIVLPLARPALATLAVFTLLGSWNDLVWPLIAINDQNSFTIQLGIANFQGPRRTDWPLLMAGNVIATLPLIVGFMFSQKHFIATMSLSGVKG